MSGAEGIVVWITGLPRAGKSTLASAVRGRLAGRPLPAVILDSDEVRAALCPTPGYDPAARDAFYTTLARLAAGLARQGFVVLVPATAHRRRYREAARELAPAFVEVHVATSLDDCMAHDRVGLYASSARGALPGIGVDYEPPTAPDVVASGGDDPSAIDQVVALVRAGLSRPSA